MTSFSSSSEIEQFTISESSSSVCCEGDEEAEPVERGRSNRRTTALLSRKVTVFGQLDIWLEAAGLDPSSDFSKSESLSEAGESGDDGVSAGIWRESRRIPWARVGWPDLSTEGVGWLDPATESAVRSR